MKKPNLRRSEDKEFNIHFADSILPGMNLPNKLTILRVLMIPFFVLFMLAPFAQNLPGTIVAFILFVAASFTDMLDGKIARKYNLITNFGKFMDPLADKLLVCSAMICLVALKRIPAWIVIVIIAREFIISGFRLVASDQGIVIAANYWGKFKTVAQMIMTGLLILHLGDKYHLFKILETVFIYLALILTVISLIDYVYKNRDVILNGGM